jgi:hypothetical protein
VLSGFQDAEPFYLPTFGYDELLPLLWERTPAQGTKSPCGVTQKTFTAPKSAPSPDKKSLRPTGSFSSIATNMEEYCQKPMWADRVLWRGADTGTLEQVRACAKAQPVAQSAMCSDTTVGLKSSFKPELPHLVKPSNGHWVPPI